MVGCADVAKNFSDTGTKPAKNGGNAWLGREDSNLRMAESSTIARRGATRSIMPPAPTVIGNLAIEIGRRHSVWLSSTRPLTLELMSVLPCADRTPIVAFACGESFRRLKCRVNVSPIASPVKRPGRLGLRLNSASARHSRLRCSDHPLSPQCVCGTDVRAGQPRDH